MAEGIFGPTPAAIQQAQADERLQRAAVIGNLPLGGFGGAIAGQLAGQAFGQAAGIEDPRLRQAQTMQEVQAQMASSGLQPGSREYTQQVTQLFRNAGQEDLAVQAHTLGTQLEQQSLGVDKQRAELQGPDPQQVPRNFEMLLQFGLPEQQAQFVAQNQKLTDEAVKQALKGRPQPELLRIAQFMHPGDVQQQRRFVKNVKLKPGASVNVNVGGKALTPAERNSIRTADGKPLPPGTTVDEANRRLQSGEAQQVSPEEAAAITRQATDQAMVQRSATEASNSINALQSIGQKLSLGSALSPSDRRAYSAARTRAAKAFAQLRNPPGTEASGQAEERLLSVLPDLNTAVVAPGALQAGIQTLQAEVAQRTGGAQAAPQTGAGQVIDFSQLPQ